MAAEPLVLGFDIGTTTAKGAAFTPTGRIASAAERAYGIRRPRAGWAEQDPEAWWGAVQEIVADIASAVPLGHAQAIGVCSQVNSYVFVDDRCEPLAPAVLWQDQRCRSLVADLQREAAAAGVKAATDASSLLAQAEWVRRERPERWRRTRWILSPKDFLNARLCGEVATDPASSFGLVGQDLDYLPGLSRIVAGVEDRLPPLRSITTPLGVAGKRLGGIPPSTTVAVATMDAWGSRYGSGLARSGDAMEVAGTSEIIGVLSSESHPRPGVVSFPPIDAMTFHAGPTQAGGAALRWIADVLRLDLPEALAEASRARSGSKGLVFLPHLMGERAPLWDASARGLFFGLTTEHSSAELVRSVLEGVAFSARHLLEELESAAGVTVSELRASGGAARSDLWCQIKADALERPIDRLGVVHTGTLGAAMIGATARGIFENLNEAAVMTDVERSFEPDPRRTGTLDALYSLYRDLYRSLGPAFVCIADLQAAVARAENERVASPETAGR